jgi:signal transduction histidine kinase
MTNGTQNYKEDPYFFFTVCEMSTNLLLALVNDTLDYAQLQAGKFKLVEEKVEIRKVVSEVLKLIFVQLMQKKQVRLRYWIDPDIPHEINGDYMRIK